MENNRSSISQIVRKFAPLAAYPVLFGLFTAVLWNLIPQQKISGTTVDAESIKFALEMMLLSHSVLASMLTASLFQKITVLKSAVRKKDLDVRDQVVDLEIPEAIDFLLLILSAAVFILSILKPTDSVTAGSVFSFSGVFIVSIWWKILHELDDPYNGVCCIKGLKELENGEEKGG